MNSEVQTWDETKQAIKEEKTPDENLVPSQIKTDNVEQTIKQEIEEKD